MSQYNDVFSGKLGLVVVYVAIIMAATAAIIFFVMAPMNKAHGQQFLPDGTFKTRMDMCYIDEKSNIVTMNGNIFCQDELNDMIQQGWSIASRTGSLGSSEVVLVKSQSMACTP